jgi:hypothetical protein
MLSKKNVVYIKIEIIGESLVHIKKYSSYTQIININKKIINFIRKYINLFKKNIKIKKVDCSIKFVDNNWYTFTILSYKKK